MKVEVELLDVDGEAVEGHVFLDGRCIAFMANITRQGEDLLVKRLHVEGDGPGTVGLAGLRAAARAIMQELGVRGLIIEGGERRTGASVKAGSGAGRRYPARLYFKLEDT